MRLSLTLGTLLCALGIMIIVGPNTPPNIHEYEHAIVNVQPQPIEEADKGDVDSAMPARFIYIQFSGEDSRMIQLQNVSDVISERLSKYSVEP